MMKSVLDKYPIAVAVKIAGMGNLLVALSFLVRLATLTFVLPSAARFPLLAYFAPFSLKTTLVIEGILAVLSAVVALGLLMKKPTITTYPGVLLCLVMVIYWGIWGWATFNPAYRMPFPALSIAFPLAALLVYGQQFLFLLAIAKHTEGEA
jgi:hypothetical protein